jgi:murein DD-endopeptidase MepM/ murein hydrolase activator NlpD
VTVGQIFAYGILPVRETLKACVLIGFCFASTAGAQEALPSTVPAAAPEIEMKNPTVSFADVDWTAVRAAVAGLDQETASDGTAHPPSGDALTRLNAATEKFFPKAAASTVPVLLPFDTASYLRDAAQGAAAETGKYASGFQMTLFFPGPSGYDAAFSLPPQDATGLDLTFAKHVDVQISGSALLYQLDHPALAEEAPVPELEKDFPGIRRILLESRLRYTFSRFGVPYAVSILCFDGPNSERRLSCHDADKVAVRFLKALNLVGGTPQSDEARTAPQTIERPDRISPDFTYYAPGDLIPGTGMKGQGGRPDTTVYAKIRFPMAQGPAYANSQSFMNWGDCDHTGRAGLGGDGKSAAYHCRVNAVPLVRDESKNYAYPWRDNFCEHRYFYVGQCPAGLGHQGQDIRPGSCLLRNEGADRCDPLQHDVVAVRDGVVMRNSGDAALYLFVDKPGEHLRFRYLHMSPEMLDAAGMVNGRALTEGEVIGAVDNYGRRQGGTTYHLHFEVQVLTRDGWVFASPYMTLVGAYERLIGGRGTVVKDAVIATASIGAPATDGQAPNPAAAADRPSDPNSAAMSTPKTDETARPALPNAIVAPIVRAESADDNPRKRTSERKIASAEHCKTRVVKGHRRRVCSTDDDEPRRRARHRVRSVDRHVPHQGDSARHHGGDVHARHARGTSRHGRA